LDRDGAGYGLPHRAKGDHEAISEEDDHAASVLLKLFAVQLLVGAQDFLGDGVALLCPKVGGPLDIREHYGEDVLKALGHMTARQTRDPAVRRFQAVAGYLRAY
jgi:hypothetical protein